jgi:hypothetical protein
MTRKAHDAIELLEADHRTVEDLFRDYRALSQLGAAGSKRQALAEAICLHAAIHMRLEEEIFYPALREAVRDDDLLDEADGEHAGAKELVGQVLAMRPGEELYDAKVTVLCEYIARHVRQERDELFPKARESGVDLAALGERLHERRRELQSVPEALREDALVSALA